MAGIPVESKILKKGGTKKEVKERILIIFNRVSVAKKNI